MIIRIMVTLLFAANVVFMVQLYGSIRQRYISDVEQSLLRAIQIELVDRISDAGLATDDGVLWLRLGLQKSGTEADADYSQGFRRMDKQILTVLTRYLTDTYDASTDEPDTDAIETALRRDLAFSGYHPEEVYVVGPGGTIEYSSNLWHVAYNAGGGRVYDAYISPLTRNILAEMSGVIVSSALIALALTFGFWYLLHVIRHLRTIEEMKDDFTNNMTHELKTPIAIAYAANDALLHFPEPADSARTARYLSAALEQLSRLSAMVENILATSMERRRHLVMARERIELRPFLEAIVDRLRLSAPKECAITLDCPEDAAIEADPTHLANVIGNLIDNSIKYSGDSVAIAVEADSAHISVSDNGTGIPEDAQSEIFKKFYRVPHGNRSDVRGYGIGLFYVKTIVDKHGWHIGVDSRLGHGSTFTITFT